jgi:hypothetical protein
MHWDDLDIGTQDWIRNLSIVAGVLLLLLIGANPILIILFAIAGGW